MCKKESDLPIFYNSRAEILHRCKIPPFAQSRTVLEPLLTNIKSEEPDILELCHLVPKEVLSLGGGKGVSKFHHYFSMRSESIFEILYLPQILEFSLFFLQPSM